MAAQEQSVGYAAYAGAKALRWNGKGVRAEKRLELILEGVRDGTCTEVRLFRDGVERVAIEAITLEENGMRFIVTSGTSYQTFKAALRDHECRVVDAKLLAEADYARDVPTIPWHDKHACFPEGFWHKTLTITTAVPTKSGAKT